MAADRARDAPTTVNRGSCRRRSCFRDRVHDRPTLFSPVCPDCRHSVLGHRRRRHPTCRATAYPAGFRLDPPRDGHPGGSTQLGWLRASASRLRLADDSMRSAWRTHSSATKGLGIACSAFPLHAQPPPRGRYPPRPPRQRNSTSAGRAPIHTHPAPACAAQPHLLRPEPRTSPRHQPT